MNHCPIANRLMNMNITNRPSVTTSSSQTTRAIGASSPRLLAYPYRTYFPTKTYHSRRCLISKRVHVFAFAEALVSKLPELARNLGKSAQTRSDNLRKRICKRFPDPSAFFAEFGDPVVPDWGADFLVGFRFNLHQREHSGIVHTVCADPLVCAGILSRCVANLFLARRTPVFTWEQLLNTTIAFDDPLVTL